MIRKYLHRGFTITLAVIALTASWGALQWPPLGAKARQWDVSTPDRHMMIGVQRAALTVSIIWPNGWESIDSFVWQAKLWGSSFYIDNKQFVLVVRQAPGSPPPPRAGPCTINATVRFWQIAVLASIYPLIMLLVWWRRQRFLKRNPNACRGCRYDLTGNETGSCPECGSPIVTDTAGPTTA